MEMNRRKLLIFIVCIALLQAGGFSHYQAGANYYRYRWCHGRAEPAGPRPWHGWRRGALPRHLGRNGDAPLATAMVVVTDSWSLCCHRRHQQRATPAGARSPMSAVLWIVIALLLGAGHSTRHRHNYGGLSMKRLVGISSAKARVGRAIGVPLTRSGRQRKIGSILWKW
jgi:hypothetical protein